MTIFLFVTSVIFSGHWNRQGIFGKRRIKNSTVISAVTEIVNDKTYFSDIEPKADNSFYTLVSKFY